MTQDGSPHPVSRFVDLAPCYDGKDKPRQMKVWFVGGSLDRTTAVVKLEDMNLEYVRNLRSPADLIEILGEAPPVGYTHTETYTRRVIEAPGQFPGFVLYGLKEWDDSQCLAWILLHFEKPAVIRDGGHP